MVVWLAVLVFSEKVFGGLLLDSAAIFISWEVKRLVNTHLHFLEENAVRRNSITLGKIDYISND